MGNSKQLDNGYPGFQLFLSFLVLMLYLANYVDIAKELLHIIMFGSAFSLWYGRNIGLNYCGRYFSVFHDLQPQKWAFANRETSSETIMRMTNLEEEKILGKNFIFVSNQLIIFFNVVSSSILFNTRWRDVPGTKMFTLPIEAVFGASMVVWYTLIIVSTISMVHDKKQPPLMTFNGLLRLIFAGLYADEITFENRYVSGIITVIFVNLFFLLLIHSKTKSKLQQSLTFQFVLHSIYQLFHVRFSFLD